MNAVVLKQMLVFAVLVWQGCAFANSDKELIIDDNQRLLVIAPHPDDENLSSAGLVKRVLNKGGKVRVVVVTTGDAYVDSVKQLTGKNRLSQLDFITYGERRIKESLNAAKFLGNGAIHVDILGFSDGSVYSALVSNWHNTNPMRSQFTHFDHVGYLQAEDKGYTQSGENLLKELTSIIKQYKPTLIVFPDVMEDDSDHAALGMFSLQAVHQWFTIRAEKASHPQLLAYLIHWRDGHWPQGADAKVALDWSAYPMQWPKDLPQRGHRRACLRLSMHEIWLKKKVLAEYKTQQLIMPDFISSFVRNTECFTQLMVNDTDNIANVIDQWQHALKVFDDNPLTRAKI